MFAKLQEVSKLTDRYQTTVPSGVRKSLGLKKGDQLRYTSQADGRVYLEPVRADGADPAIAAFLGFIADDITAHPERLQHFDGALQACLTDLVGDMDVDLDAPLSADDE